MEKKSNLGFRKLVLLFSCVTNQLYTLGQVSLLTSPGLSCLIHKVSKSDGRCLNSHPVFLPYHQLSWPLHPYTGSVIGLSLTFSTPKKGVGGRMKRKPHRNANSGKGLSRELCPGIYFSLTWGKCIAIESICTIYIMRKKIFLLKKWAFLSPQRPLIFLLKNIEIHSKEENSITICACGVGFCLCAHGCVLFIFVNALRKLYREVVVLESEI